MIKRFPLVFFLCTASVSTVFAQGPAFDTSGNGLLSGSYYFRHILYGISTAADSSGIEGDITEAIAVYGNIVFDGNGNYSINNANVSDSTAYPMYGVIALSCYIANTTCTTGTPVTGAYSISASGFGFLQNPITGDKIFGLVSSNGIFIGSSTEATQAYNDLFITAAIPSPTPTTSFFQGSYSVAGFFPLPGNPAPYSEDAFFQMNPNGAGSLGTVNVTGYAGTNGSAIGATTVSQSTAATYTFSNGAAVVSFPTNANANFFPGGAQNPEYFYFSPDGNFFFGGSPTSGYDMIVGVRNPSGTQNFTGLYYQAGLDQDDSNLSGGMANFDAYYGSFNALPAGEILEHQRVSSPFNSGSFGSTFADSVTPPVTGTYTDTPGYEQYAVGGGGEVRIGQGIYPYLGINVALKAPAFSGPGVYLSPAGIVNAASFSPFTAGVSNGEMVTLFGSNLAPGTVSATSLPLPTTLDGVQVLVNGTPAPINYVSPGQILIVTPFGNTFDVAQFQVMNGAASNVVTELVNPTTPGVFTADYGLGVGYAVDATGGFVVTEATPAQPGDSVEAFVSGLGTVFPTVPDGAAAPLSPLSPTTQAITVVVGGINATVSFAGLVPTLAGLYQVNFTVPSTTPAGNNTLDISGPDSYNSQALIPVGTGLSPSVRKGTVSGRRARKAATPDARPPACFPAPAATCKDR